MINWLIRAALLWWLISVVYRWLRGDEGTKAGRSEAPRSSNDKNPDDIPFTGEIEDADFEEIDDREA